jgi:hypothetical protein
MTSWNPQPSDPHQKQTADLEQIEDDDSRPGLGEGNLRLRAVCFTIQAGHGEHPSFYHTCGRSPKSSFGPS